MIQLTIALILLIIILKPQPLQFRDLFYNENYKNHMINAEQWLAFNNDNKVCISIIKGPYSYGGDQGLYEMWDYRNPENNEYNGPIGYLTIDDINKHLTKYPL